MLSFSFLHTRRVSRVFVTALVAAIVGACTEGPAPVGTEPKTETVTYPLSVTVEGTGSGTVSSSPAGISCGAGNCSASYVTGTSVTLTATPTGGSSFNGWQGACAGTGVCAVTMSQSRSVSASFTAPTPVAVASISVTPGINAIDVGGTVQLTAVTRAADNSILNGRPITWTSSNNSVASVSTNGIVTAIAFGDTAYITATSGSVSASAAVFVRPPVVTVVASDANASEAGPDNGAFTISRTGPVTNSLTVNFAISGTATNGVDYSSVPNNVVIAAGQASAVVSIVPQADGNTEGAETVILGLSNGAYAIGLPASATISIADQVTAPSNNPIVSVIASDASASETGNDVGVFTISRTGLTINPLTVSIAMSGSATNGTDYAVVLPTVTIPAGQASVALQITPVVDAINEGNESVVLNVVAGPGYDIGNPSTATVNISDAVVVAKPLVTIVATDANASEVGNDAGVFQLSRTGSTVAPLTVSVAMSGTASNGFDYIFIGESVTIPAGQSAVLVSLTPISDALVEGNESSVMSLVASTQYDFGASASATITIADTPVQPNIPVVTIVATDASASEIGLDAGAFTFTRTGATTGALTVTFAVTGTAVNGVDYATIGTSVTIPAGQVSANVIVTPLTDALVESAETVVLTVQPSASYATGAPATATVTIADAIAPVVKPVISITATDATASETGADNGMFTVTRTGVTTSALAVDVVISGTATNGVDYGTIAASVTIPVGQASASIAVVPIADVAVENAETVIVTVAANAAYDIGTPSSATVTIADAATPTKPSISIVATDANASETGSDNGTFTVSRTGSTTAALSVSVIVSGTATNGTDYGTISTTLSIPAGQASATISVVPIVDAAVEGAETVIVGIAANAAYDIGTPASATVTIADAGAPVVKPTVSITATDANASEVGPDIGTFNVARTGVTTSALVVDISVTGTASIGVDYTTIAATLTIPAGQSSATITVTPIVDFVVEGAETVIATIAANASYDIGTPSNATVTIADLTPVVKPTVSVSTTDAVASEVGPDNGAFTVTRTGSTTATLAVNFVVSGTATNGTDYSTVATSVTFGVGQASVAIPVVPILDAATEGPETVIITLAANAAYDIGTPSNATLTIADAPPTSGGGSLVSGVTSNGRIAAPAATQTWTLTANQGDRIIVSIGETGSLNPQFTPWIRLNSPTNVLLSSQYGSQAAQIDVAATVTGTYTVTVASADGGAIGIGDYRLTLVKAPGVQTISAGDEGGPLTNGITHTGDIYLGDVDPWTFTVGQGERIVVSIGETGTFNSQFTPWIRLIGPTGVVVASQYGAQAAQIDVAAPTAGTYTVVVGTADGGIDGTGNYLLTILTSPGSFNLSAGDQGGPLTNGAIHTGRIYLGDVDAWTFTATQGERIVLGVAETGVFDSQFTPWIRLIGPTGVVVSSNYGAQAAQADLAAPSSGTYTVIVGTADGGVDGTGDYRLTLVRAPGTFVVSAGDQGGTLTNGAIHTGRIDLGDVDAWTFTATQGERIVLGVAETGVFDSQFTPWIRLIGPTGVVVSSNYGAQASQADLAAPTSGTYTVIVGTADGGVDGTGDYRLTLVRAPGTFTVSPGDHGGTLTNGAIHTGRIDLGDVDAWTFTATQGDRIVLSVAETGVFDSQFTPWIRLIGPTGVVVSSNYGAQAAQADVAAPTSGNYTVIIGTADGGVDGTGDYRLTLVQVPGSFTVSPGDQGGALTNGAVHTGTIALGDVDAWTFAATQGERIVVAIGETGSFNTQFTPWIRLISPTGVVVTSTYGAQSAQADLAAPTTGTYTVIVGTADGGIDGVGDYRLTLVKSPGSFTVSPGDQGGALTNGGTHSGRIDLGDVDSWTFTANQGERIVVSLGETGTFDAQFTPWIRLISPTGALLASNYGSQATQSDVAAPSTGTYTVIIGTADGGYDGTGDYRLSLVKAPGTYAVSAGDEGGALTTNTSHTGSIVLGDVDVWTFSASQSERIVISMTKSGTTNPAFTPWIRVINPNGVVVFTNVSSTAASVDFPAPIAGSYTVIVGSGDGGYDGTGGYLIKLTRP